MPAAEGRFTTSELQKLEALGWGSAVREALETPRDQERARRDPYRTDRADVDLDDGIGHIEEPVLPIDVSLVRAGVAVDLPQE